MARLLCPVRSMATRSGYAGADEVARGGAAAVVKGFDRYNIIHEQELLDAGDQLVEYLAQQAQAVPARRRPHPAGTAAPRPAPALRLVRRTTA